MKRIVMAMAVGLIATSVSGGQAPNWSQKAGWSSRFDGTIQIPFKVFDNIYYVGTDHVSSYLITTSDGLVLIDATNAKTVEGVLNNIRKLGFDTRNIKYVFITQAHQDHYGGAPRIKEATGATIGMSDPDMTFLEKKNLHANDPEYQWSTDPAPARDLVIGHGKVIKVFSGWRFQSTRRQHMQYMFASLEGLTCAFPSNSRSSSSPPRWQVSLPG